MQFGTAVKSLRRHLGFSQEELAGRAGLHRTYIPDIERGARNVSPQSIEKLAAALQSSIPTLFSGGSIAPVSPEQCVEILLVEDDPRDVELTLKAFARAGIANPVQVARDGAEALDFAFRTAAWAGRNPSHQPCVILLDLKLPKVDGLSVLRRLKADPRTQAIPVIVLTDSQENRDVIECRRLGVENYIVKPVDFHRLSSVTQQLSFRWALLKPLTRISA